MFRPERLPKIAIILQSFVFAITLLVGITNDDSNGFNGMQAIFAVPLLIVVLASVLARKPLRSKFVRENQWKLVKLTDISLITVCILVIAIDIGIVASAFLADYYINIFIF